MTNASKDERAPSVADDARSSALGPASVASESSLSVRGVTLALGALAVVVAGLFLASRLIGIDRVRATIEAAGVYAPLLYIVVKASTYVIAPISGGPIQVASGALFGLWGGTVYSLIGDVIGGSANYWIGRRLGPRIVTMLTGTKGMQRVDAFGRQLLGWQTLALARVFLSAVYDYVSYAAGLAAVNFKQYVIVTIICGVLPTMLFVGIGAGLAEDPRTVALLYAGVGLVSLAPVLYYWRRRRTRGR